MGYDLYFTFRCFSRSFGNGTWGGSATWAGTKNPLAVSQAAAYTKFHERTLFADMTLTQDLSSITPGLGASGMLSYDNYAQYWENHSKTFVYGSNSVTAWENGVPSSTTYYTDGKESSMSSDAKCIAFTRVFNFAVTLFYDKQINKDNKIYSQLNGTMNTVIPKGPIRPGIVRMPLSILIMDTKINILQI